MWLKLEIPLHVILQKEFSNKINIMLNLLYV